MRHHCHWCWTPGYPKPAKSAISHSLTSWRVVQIHCDSTVIQLWCTLMSGLLDRKDAKACHKIPRATKPRICKSTSYREQQIVLPLHPDFGLGTRWDLDLVPETWGKQSRKHLRHRQAQVKAPQQKKWNQSMLWTTTVPKILFALGTTRQRPSYSKFIPAFGLMKKTRHESHLPKLRMIILERVPDVHCNTWVWPAPRAAEWPSSPGPQISPTWTKADVKPALFHRFLQILRMHSES